jgi:hypothetical protein
MLEMETTSPRKTLSSPFPPKYPSMACKAHLGVLSFVIFILSSQVSNLSLLCSVGLFKVRRQISDLFFKVVSYCEGFDGHLPLRSMIMRN